MKRISFVSLVHLVLVGVFISFSAISSVIRLLILLL